MAVAPNSQATAMIVENKPMTQETLPVLKSVPARPAYQPALRRLHDAWQGKKKKRPNRRPPSRRALTVGLVVFFLLQGGLALVIALSPDQFGDPTYQARVKRLRAQQVQFPGRPVMAFFGSSRVMFGLDIQGLEHISVEAGQPIIAASFDYPGGGPITQVLMLRRLLREGIKPKKVLVELMPAYLGNQKFPDELEEWRLPSAKLGLDDARCLRPYLGENRPRLEQELWMGRFIPWSLYRFDLLNLAAPNLLPLEKRTFPEQAFLNFDAANVLPDDLERERRRRAMAIAEKEYKDRLNQLRIGGPAVQAVEDLIRTCQDQGIEVALILMPEGPIFQSWSTREKQNEVTDFAHRLQHQFTLDLIDARNWFPEEDYFYDSHHQLPATGRLFTRRLAENHLFSGGK